MNVIPTWIVIADGTHAQVHSYRGPNRKLTAVKGGDFSSADAAKPSRELADEERGRVFHSADGSRSAMERTTDPHEHEKEQFAHEVAQFLESHTDRFERLVMAAPPKMLGYLRQQLSKNTLHKITAELDKDLTKIPDTKLENHLQSVLPLNPEKIKKEERRLF